MSRISERKTLPTRQDYLHYRFLWPDIKRSVAAARRAVGVEAPLVLDVGCGNRPYRDLFAGCRYVGVDASPVDTRPDAVMVGDRLALVGDTFDIVFCTQVLEHVPDPGALIRELHRVLRPGGRLVLTVPFWWPLHEEPYDFHRFTSHGLAHHLGEAGFEEFEITPQGGDWALVFLVLAQRMRGRWLAPARLVTNLTGAVLDRLWPSYTSPSGWTVTAGRAW